MKKVLLILTALIVMISLMTFAQETKTPIQPAGTVDAQTPPAKPVPTKRELKKLEPVKEGKVLTPVVEDSGPPPKLEIPELEYHAGDVVKGTLVEHDYLVHNKGQGILKIIRVQPTCGCTITKYDPEVKPGETGKITASLKTDNYMGETAKTINVQTNDKDLSTFTLTIKANIKTLLSVKPSEKMTLGLIYVGTPVEKEFTINSEDGEPFDITQVTTADEKVKYNIIPGPDKKSAKFQVTIPADYPVGSVNANFSLKTTHPKVENLNINMFGTMREPLSVFPSTVSFNGLNKEFIEKNPESPELNKVVTVRLETEPALQVKEVKCNIPFIVATFESTQPNQAYSVKLHLDPKKAKIGPFDGALLVYTNKKTITVPVKGVVF